MALHGNPRAARGDAHLLVVITRRAAGGEGVAQPEAVILAYPVGDVGEGRGAFVSRNHQVGIILIIAHHIGGRDDRSAHDIIGDIEQAGEELAVAGDALLQVGLAPPLGRWLLDDEAALRADRHDHRVFHHLRFHQAEDLGTEILRTVRPAQAAACDLAAAQVDALGADGIDENLCVRTR